jgi:hypothetical protein
MALDAFLHGLSMASSTIASHGLLDASSTIASTTASSTASSTAASFHCSTDINSPSADPHLLAADGVDDPFALGPVLVEVGLLLGELGLALMST